MSTERMLRIDAVCERVGGRRAAIYKEIQAGRFPRPVKIFGRRASAWPASEIDAWLKARIAERDTSLRK